MNPRISENISSLARIVRSLVQPSLESVVTWHERDITQSAAERFTIPEAFILTDHILGRMIDVLSGLAVFPDRMIRNLKVTGGLQLSEALVGALVRKGVERPKAFRAVRSLAIESIRQQKSFQELVSRNTEIKKHLSEKEMELVFDPRNYLGKTSDLIRQALERTKQERRLRSLAA